MSIGPPELDLQRQTTSTSSDEIPFAGAAGGSVSLEPEVTIEDNKPPKLDQNRQQRTRPMASTHYHGGLQQGKWQLSPQRVLLPWKHNWQVLCEDANLDSSSRVIIANILTQPVGHPLALFLAKQCGVKDVLGIDSLFPNKRPIRLEQMETYRELKRGIDRMQLLVPSADPSIDDGSLERMIAFQPTHVIHLATTLPEYGSVLTKQSLEQYTIKSGLKSVDNSLRAIAAVFNETANRWHQPRFVYVTTIKSKGKPWTELSEILVRTFHRLFGFPTTLLRMPPIYGPMVASPNVVSDQYMHEKMYVTNAMAGILTGLEYSKTERSIFTRPMVVDIDSAEGVTSYNTYYQLKRHHKRETGAWVELWDHYHLGNSITEADYLDIFGIPRNHFPCASSCQDYECVPSAFDEVKDITRRASEDCVYAVYFGNFSVAFDYLEPPKKIVEGSTICRFAFLSGRSRFVRNLLSSDPVNLADSEDAAEFDESVEIDEARLLSENGEYEVDGWRIIWLGDHDEGTMSPADLALLRIDPAALFADAVELALYTERDFFMRAKNKDLRAAFEEMTLERMGAFNKKVRNPKTGLWQTVKIRRQRARRVVFFAKEESMWESLDEFVQRAASPIPRKQIAFYNESTSIIMSNVMRPRDEIQSSSLKEFPYHWISYHYLIHDLQNIYGEQFRCAWYKEFTFWGGERDAELLSLAYMIGRNQAEGIFSDAMPRESGDRRDVSWIQVMNAEDPAYALIDEDDQEVHIRLVPSE